MATLVGRGPGGISALLADDRDVTRAALEAELLRCGLTLDAIPGRVSWRAVMSLIATAAPGTTLGVAAHGEKHRWRDAEYLLAAINDAAVTAVWQRTKDGRKGRNRPDPTPRPGVENKRTKRFGDAAMSLTEVKAWLASLRAGRGE